MLLAQLSHRLVADLAHTLALQSHLLSYLGKSLVMGTDAVCMTDDMALALVEHIESLLYLVNHRLVDGGGVVLQTLLALNLRGGGVALFSNRLVHRLANEGSRIHHKAFVGMAGIL